MANTYTSLYYHLVFSTKNRQCWISPDIEQRVWSYLGGIARKNDMHPHEIGGTEDHVHLLVTLRQDASLADFMRELKAGSSRWVHDTFPAAADFAWQETSPKPCPLPSALRYSLNARKPGESFPGEVQ